MEKDESREKEKWRSRIVEKGKRGKGGKWRR